MELDDALAGLVAQSGDRLLRVGYQLTHDRAAAQDRAMVPAGSTGLLICSPDGHAIGTLVRLPARAVINEYVRTRRLRSSTEVVTDAVPEHGRPIAQAPRPADRAQLWDALGALSSRQRAVLVLRYYEGLADNEIAALLGCREASVRSLASRGLAAMRQHAVLAGISGEED